MAEKPAARPAKSPALTLTFAGEPVPMHNKHVAARYRQELAKARQLRHQSPEFVGRIYQALPRIERILHKRGIPEDFKYLAVVESLMGADTSAKGAAGIWQIMPHTARELGLVLNDEMDERYHLESATEAACNYLREAHNQFGSWTITAAAYNRGTGGVARAVKQQGAHSFYHLRFNAQTARYIYRILAYKEVLEHPARYELPTKAARRQATRPLKVKRSIPNLWRFAKNHGTTYPRLQQLNPWLRASTLTVTDERPVYTLHLPH